MVVITQPWVRMLTGPGTTLMMGRSVHSVVGGSKVMQPMFFSIAEDQTLKLLHNLLRPHLAKSVLPMSQSAKQALKQASRQRKKTRKSRRTMNTYISWIEFKTHQL